MDEYTKALATQHADHLKRESYLRELGLWAEKHGVPALKEYGLPCAVWMFHGPYGFSPDPISVDRIREAIELIPKTCESGEKK